MESPLEVLGRSTYVLLTTFRRDGRAVPTPVWVVLVGDELLVWTNPTAGKVKRIRQDRHVEIGPCGRTGKPLGRPISGIARILESDELGAVMPALIRKYGLIARLTTLPTALNVLLGKPPLPIGGIAICVTVGLAADHAPL